MTARKLACDGCRKSKVRCDGQEGVSSCSRCAKKSIECTWDTPRSKRGRKSNTNRLSTETGMGLFCLTPKNLIELNYTPSNTSSSGRVEQPPPQPQPQPQHIAIENNSTTSYYNTHNFVRNDIIAAARGDSSSEEGAGPGTLPPPANRDSNWALPLPLRAQQRFNVKTKANSLEGLPSFHKIPLSPRSQRPRSLDELGRSEVFSPTLKFKMEPPAVNTSQPSPQLPNQKVSTPLIPLSLSLPETMDLDDVDPEEPDYEPQSHSMSNSHDSVSVSEEPLPLGTLSFRGSRPQSKELLLFQEPLIRNNSNTTVAVSAAESDLRRIRTGVEQMDIRGITSPVNYLEHGEFRGVRNPVDDQMKSQEQEEVRRKCSIVALLNASNDEEQDNPHYMFSKYPSRK